MYLSLLLGFLLFPEIPATLETHVHKKINPQHIKMSRIMVFCSDREIKLVSENRASKIQGKFHTAKISCHI